MDMSDLLEKEKPFLILTSYHTQDLVDKLQISQPLPSLAPATWGMCYSTNPYLVGSRPLKTSLELTVLSSCAKKELEGTFISAFIVKDKNSKSSFFMLVTRNHSRRIKWGIY